MKQRSNYEIAIDSDRITTAGMAVLLVGGIGLTISEARHLFWGRTVEQVSLGTVVLALSCLAFAFSFKEKLFKLAFALIGTQASVRAVLSYAHVSHDSQHIAAIGGLILSPAGHLMMIAAALKWFRSVVRRIPTPEREDPTP
jgi:hypothetical protein